MGEQKSGQPAPSPELLEIAVELWSQSDGQHYLPIAGSSMKPLLQEGDLVLVSHGNSLVNRGDIVVFRLAGGLITHRVIEISQIDENKVLYQTKGDNTPYPDPQVKSGDILGRVTAVKRRGRLFPIDNRVWRWMNDQIACLVSIAMKPAHRKSEHPGKLPRSMPLYLSRLLVRILTVRFWFG